MGDRFARRVVPVIVGLFMVVGILLSACGGEKRELLSYQEEALEIEGVFSVDGKETRARISLEAPEYDGEGRMLARRARVVIEESSVSGGAFEFSGGRAYVVSGALKIPVEDEEMVRGVTEILSLFSIRPESFCGSERREIDGEDFIEATYSEGADPDTAGNRVVVLLDADTYMPVRITASVAQAEISAEISSIRTVS
ncbi:MAG: hypothetical protein PUG87_11525 [Eubacteriales bacterium]|nr:hypothetical protein [Eubacteriales bacterium]